METILTQYYQSPYGELLLGSFGDKLCLCDWLQNIPYGKTVSYGELSRKLGNPKAVRAVAAANGANALSILIPCHRVVGSNHTLIGYAGGLAAKQGMLALEADSCDGPSGSRIGQLF